MLLISSEVKHRAADHNVGNAIWKGHPLNRANLEVFGRNSGPEGSGQLPYMLDSFTIQVECKHLAAFTQKIYEVPSIAASSIKNAHPRCNVSSQNLVKNIDVNVSKLLLNAECHALHHLSF
jgi:hypothetical protein